MGGVLGIEPQPKTSTKHFKTPPCVVPGRPGLGGGQ